MDESQDFLDRISVASPCSADWDSMTGDDRSRFCGQCQLNVYNLSAMSRPEAEALVQEKEGRLCVRYYRRYDGTLITRDCPVGLKTLHQRRIKRFGAVAAAVTLITVIGVFTVRAQAVDRTAGGIAPMPQHVKMGEAVAPQHLMGKIAQPTPTPPLEIKGRPQVIMGDIAAPPPNVTPCPLPKKGNGQQ